MRRYIFYKYIYFIYITLQVLLYVILSQGFLPLISKDGREVDAVAFTSLPPPAAHAVLEFGFCVWSLKVASAVLHSAHPYVACCTFGHSRSSIGMSMFGTVRVCLSRGWQRLATVVSSVLSRVSCQQAGGNGQSRVRWVFFFFLIKTVTRWWLCPSTLASFTSEANGHCSTTRGMNIDSRVFISKSDINGK